MEKKILSAVCFVLLAVILSVSINAYCCSSKAGADATSAYAWISLGPDNDDLLAGNLSPKDDLLTRASMTGVAHQYNDTDERYGSYSSASVDSSIIATGDRITKSYSVAWVGNTIVRQCYYPDN